ncbi:unnamed protein product [Darwinula stevensoni]|uniref:FYVE-type domain-containing protein n=1 Tax=Darwinula stevensoni TaxID=69355 RepID=A0A7R8XEK2_9CRUS|nr:unnamed protein product [Darwinula stevensoni]CAG0895893.1 unnamed protein product [Darwinula stevensoni]
MESSPTIEELKKHICDLEESKKCLRAEKEQMEQDFGMKRAKFRELYLHKEEQLNKESEALMKSQAEEQRLQKEVQRLQSELDDAKSQVTIAQCTLENVEVENHRWQEEVATLRRVLSDVEEEKLNIQQALEHKKDKNQKLNVELSRLRRLIKPDQDAGESILASLKKRVGAIAAGEISINPPQSTSTSIGSSSDPGSLENLEDSMRRAQEEQQVLQNIVAPLEEEILVLKDKLRLTDEQLQAYEQCQADVVNGSKELATLVQESKNFESLLQEISLRLEELLKRKDLQSTPLALYFGVLNFQKTMYLSEIRRLRKQVKDAYRGFSTDSQLLTKLQLMHSLLTKEQLVQFEELTKGGYSGEYLRLGGCEDTSPSRSLDEDAYKMREEVQHGIRDESASLRLSSLDTSGPQGSVDTDEGHSDEPSSERDSSLFNHQDSGNTQITEESECQQLQDEASLRTQNLILPSFTAIELEQQLCASRKEAADAHKQISLLEQKLSRYKEDLDREAHYRREDEDKWSELSKNYEAQLSQLQKRLEERERIFEDLRGLCEQTKTMALERFKQLTLNRQEVQDEINRLEAENEMLMGKYKVHTQALHRDLPSVPNTLEEMQQVLHHLREELIRNRVAKEHLEESLRSEILFLKDQISAEQSEKESLEISYNTEISELKEQVGIMQTIQAQLEKEESLRVEFEEKHSGCKKELDEIRARSLVLEASVKDLSSLKEQLEKEVTHLWSRVSTLQQEVENSEANQRDFVRLTQSLQVELEGIRQGENEVRWQHEEDVNHCPRCSRPFTAILRKHHCRHCGKIYCSECTSQTVGSGPHGRPSRVCDVCHTILVRDSAPYFSRHAPNLPE